MNQSKYENGAIITKNHAVLEEYEIDVYFELCNEVAKLLKNVDGLGRQELPNGTETEVREKGVQFLKENYATAYDNLVKRIGELANQYIKINCFNLMFYQDAANIMLVNPVEVIRGYISEKSSDVKKAIFMDYSVLEFTGIVDEIREKVTKLAIDNWEKHKESFIKLSRIMNLYTSKNGEECSRIVPLKYLCEDCVLELQMIDGDGFSYYSNDNRFILIRPEGSLATDHEFFYVDSMLDALDKGKLKYRS